MTKELLDNFFEKESSLDLTASDYKKKLKKNLIKDGLFNKSSLKLIAYLSDSYLQYDERKSEYKNLSTDNLYLINYCYKYLHFNDKEQLKNLLLEEA